MKKPKKITIKPFLNEKLEQVEMTFTEGDNHRTVLGYPLYYMVIYNRNNTKLKSRVGLYYPSLEHETIKGVIETETKTLEKTLRYIISIKGEDVDLKGLASAYDSYSKGIVFCMEKYLKKKLQFAAMGVDSRLSFIIHFDDWRNSFSTYYDVVLRLFDGVTSKFEDDFIKEIEAYNSYVDIESLLKPEIENPKIIDWLYGDYKNAVLQKIPQAENRQHVIKLMDAVIDKLSF